MTKLHSELLRKNGETGDLIPGGTFRLRFDATDEPFIKPHFSALLDLAKQEPEKILANEAIEVDFIITQVDGDHITGTYTEALANTEDLLIEQHIDYDAEVPDPVKEVPLVLPDTLSEAALTAATKLADNSYPEPGHVKISGGKHAANFVEAGIITFEVDKWKGDQHKERTSWIVYSGHSSDTPILYYQFENNSSEKSDVNKKGFTREIDFSKLPLGKYRVEAIGKWGLWHADHKKNRFGIAIDPKKKRAEYAYTDIESTADRLTDITTGDDKLIAPDEQVTFSTGSLFNDANSLVGMTWTVSNAQGETMQNQTTGVQTSSISLKFPTPGGNTVQEYTLKATSGSGLTTERKIQVNFLKRKGEAELVDRNIPKDQRTRAGAKTIAIIAGPHSGTNVGLRPVTFKVTSPDKDADFSWIVYQGKDAAYPIDIQFDYGREFAVDFSKLPEGDYMVEAFGRVSQWHSNHGEDRFGEPVKPSTIFAKMKVTSKPNVLENVNSKNLLKGEKSKQWETNWGVPVVFDADLLFDFDEDIAQLTWEITDKENIPLYEDQTLAAKGNAHPTFNFDQPTADTEYTLKLTLNGVSKTQKFIVVAQAYVKNIQLTGDANKFVYSQQRTLNFSVKDYTQQQANVSDKAKVKWVRVFFPDIHYEDYKSEQLVYTYKAGTITSATFGSHTTTNLQVFEGKGEKLDVAAGIPETTATASPYKKGLYFVEAYMNKPDGKKGAMDVYELARNEPSGISQYQVLGFNDYFQVPNMAFVRPGAEYFGFAVNAWQFGSALGEENNVKWALYDIEGTTLLKTFSEQGIAVPLNFGFLTVPDGESKDYVLKAYTGDVLRGASLKVRAAKPKILDMFYCDSTGRRIKECGVGDKVYMYAKTTGLEYEKVQINVFESDDWGDDLVKGQVVTVNEKGVIFQEIELTKTLLESYEGKENPFQLYLTLSFDKDSAIILPNESFSRDQVHYMEIESTLLDVTYDMKETDFGFFDSNWLPLKTAVKVGDKVKVRVRVTNVGTAKFHIYILDLNNKEMPLAESNTDLTATKEGYLEMEFVVPEGWYTGDGTTPRYFYPFARTTGWAVTIKPTLALTDVGKMLKVAKDPATTPVFEDNTEYADLPKSQTTTTDSKVPTSITLAFGSKVDQMFALKVVDISQRVQCDPNDLMAIINVESAGSFSPYKLEGSMNLKPKEDITDDDLANHAVGLIQFTGAAVKGLKNYTGVSYTKREIADMSAVEQLELVGRYIEMWKKINKLEGPLTLGDLYMIIFAPGKMVGGDDNTILYAAGTEEYNSNASLDTDKTDGGITKRELAARAYVSLQKGSESQNSQTFILTDITGDNHVYKVDISQHTNVKTNDPGADKNVFIYYVYDGGTLLGYHVMIRNSHGLLDFPYIGPNWNRFGDRDAGGDNFASEESAGAALGFFYSLPKIGFNEILTFNDISAFDKRDIGHDTHATGCDFDIRYPGCPAGGRYWYESVPTYGSEEAFVTVLESVLKVASEWKFENNYAYKYGIAHTRNTAFDVHDNHFHIGYKE